MTTGLGRCTWAQSKNPRMVEYHDTEWGVPVTNDQVLFEFMVLESAQAGLSWEVVLNKRDGYRAVFHGFDPMRVAAMTEDDVSRLCADASIIRNAQKIRASIKNAQAFLKVAEEWGSFAAYQWSWTENTTVHNSWKASAEVPAITPLALEMSKDLKKRGFSFLGPTVWYAHLQATGVVNDHTTDCFRHAEVAALRPQVPHAGT